MKTYPRNKNKTEKINFGKELFLVVKFVEPEDGARTFECIPDNWFVEDDEERRRCYWPPKSKQSFTLRAMNREKPGADWNVYSCEVVSDGHATYSIGASIVREKASQKYNTSSADEHIQIAEFRRKHPGLISKGEKCFESVFAAAKAGKALEENQKKIVGGTNQQASSNTDMAQLASDEGKQSSQGKSYNLQKNKSENHSQSVESRRSRSRRSSIPDTPSRSNHFESHNNRPSSHSNRLRSRGSRTNSHKTRSSSGSSRSKSDINRSRSRSNQSKSRSVSHNNRSRSRSSHSNPHKIRSSSGSSRSKSHTNRDRSRSNQSKSGFVSHNNRSWSRSSRSNSHKSRSSSGSSRSKSHTNRSRSLSNQSKSRFVSHNNRSLSGSNRSKSNKIRSRSRSYHSQLSINGFESGRRYSSRVSKYRPRSTSTTNTIRGRTYRGNSKQNLSSNGTNKHLNSGQDRSRCTPLHSKRSDYRQFQNRHCRPTKGTQDEDSVALSRERSKIRVEAMCRAHQQQQQAQNYVQNLSIDPALHHRDSLDMAESNDDTVSIRSLLKEVRDLKAIVSKNERRFVESDRRLTRLEVTGNKSFIVLNDLSNAINTRMVLGNAPQRETNPPKGFRAPKLPIKHLRDLIAINKDFKNDNFFNFLVNREKEYCTYGSSSDTVTMTAYLKRFISVDLRASLVLKELRGEHGLTLYHDFPKVYEFLREVMKSGYQMTNKILTNNAIHLILRTVWGRSKQALAGEANKKR